MGYVSVVTPYQLQYGIGPVGETRLLLGAGGLQNAQDDPLWASCRYLFPNGVASLPNSYGGQLNGVWNQSGGVIQATWRASGATGLGAMTMGFIWSALLAVVEYELEIYIHGGSFDSGALYLLRQDGLGSLSAAKTSQLGMGVECVRVGVLRGFLRGIAAPGATWGVCPQWESGGGNFGTVNFRFKLMDKGAQSSYFDAEVAPKIEAQERLLVEDEVRRLQAQALREDRPVYDAGDYFGSGDGGGGSGYKFEGMRGERK